MGVSPGVWYIPQVESVLLFLSKKIETGKGFQYYTIARECHQRGRMSYFFHL
jgi:hypothetical protein